MPGSGGFGSKPFAAAAFAGDLTTQQFVQETVVVSDTDVATRVTLASTAELAAVADGITVTVLSAAIKFTQESVSVSDSQTTRIVWIATDAETAAVLDGNSANPSASLNSNSETVSATDVLVPLLIPLPVNQPFDVSGIAVFTDAEAPVAGSLAIGGGTTTTATNAEIVSIADTNAGYVNVIPPPFPVITRDHDGVSRQPYPKRHKYKVPDLIAAELHRRNKLRSQIEDVMQDASYLPNLLGRSNKIVQLPAKAAKPIVPKLDQLPSSPERISDLSRLIVSLRHRSPNDDEEAMNLILQNLWKP
jgi:hypothetical protein